MLRTVKSAVSKISLLNEMTNWRRLTLMFMAPDIEDLTIFLAFLYTAFIDITKTFDFIVGDILWLKLIKFGVRGKILDIIKSMYQSIKSKVKFNKNISSEFSCHLGVRQGGCLSPFLFSIFLNDIEDEFIKQKCELIDIGTLKLFLLLYTDDIVIFSERSEGLQKALNTLYEYSQHRKLTVNINKTKILIFRSGGILPKNLVFTYDGKELDFVDDFKYLGISFTAGNISSFSRRRGRVVRAARLWCRKSPYRVSSRLGCAMRRLENSLCQPSRKWVPFST